MMYDTIKVSFTDFDLKNQNEYSRVIILIFKTKPFND